MRLRRFGKLGQQYVLWNGPDPAQLILQDSRPASSLAPLRWLRESYSEVPEDVKLAGVVWLMGSPQTDAPRRPSAYARAWGARTRIGFCSGRGGGDD